MIEKLKKLNNRDLKDVQKVLLLFDLLGISTNELEELVLFVKQFKEIKAKNEELEKQIVEIRKSIQLLEQNDNKKPIFDRKVIDYNVL